MKAASHGISLITGADERNIMLHADICRRRGDSGRREVVVAGVSINCEGGSLFTIYAKRPAVP